MTVFTCRSPIVIGPAPRADIRPSNLTQKSYRAYSVTVKISQARVKLSVDDVDSASAVASAAFRPLLTPHHVQDCPIDAPPANLPIAPIRTRNRRRSASWTLREP